MKIPRERLTEIARTFLQVLDKEKVRDVRDLERLAGQTIPIDGRDFEYFSVSWRPFNLGTRALDASYIIQHKPNEIGGGIPLCLKINCSLGYSQIIVKTLAEIEGYLVFNEDPFGNKVQMMLVESIELQKAREEIERLTRT
ncbi:hypothetical protein FJZ19_00835 [Candidatus Pacearchaeota archaeon]|nr:hypothetical protein [Candidatus Pacearchaeota archaeon]